MSTVRSQAQYEKLGELLKKGKITEAQYRDMTSGVAVNKLPTRIHPKQHKSPHLARRKHV